MQLYPYQVSRGTTPQVHPWIADFETKTIRAEACFRAALQLKANGYSPDVIIAHHGWGESLFLNEVWPQAKLGIYCEFFYHPQGADVGFDPEFPAKDPGDVCRLRLKNLNNLLHIERADAGISPTHWQASTFPEPFRSRISVIHDGIDTDALAPTPAVTLTLSTATGTQVTLGKQDEVITFVNRNLEPYRGYHIFMRALPAILQRRPERPRPHRRRRRLLATVPNPRRARPGNRSSSTKCARRSPTPIGRGCIFSVRSTMRISLRCCSAPACMST